MQAIPTTYKGTTFRSRLEADFANTWDWQRVARDYEPEGFKLSDGTQYLPDFYLPTSRAWVEVKGPHMERVSKVEQFAAEAFLQSGAESYRDSAAPMVVLADLEYGPGEAVARYIGVCGPGKRRSVILARCPWCKQGVFLTIGQEECPNCSTRRDVAAWIFDYNIGWHDESSASKNFHRIPRGRTRSR